MRFVSPNAARVAWYGLAGIFAAEAIGMMLLAPYWNGGAIHGQLNALACFIGGGAVALLLLGATQPGKSLSTRITRYLFALTAGLAADVIVTWALWAIGVPIENGTVRRGLMGENYWLGPAILAYAVLVWLSYRKGLNRDGEARPA